MCGDLITVVLELHQKIIGPRGATLIHGLRGTQKHLPAFSVRADVWLLAYLMLPFLGDPDYGVQDRWFLNYLNHIASTSYLSTV